MSYSEAKYDVYICYSREDLYDENNTINPDNAIYKIKHALSEAGISYWIDEECMKSGEHSALQIVSSIESSAIVLFIASKNSIASEWAMNEIVYAYGDDKHIIPVRIDETSYRENRKLPYYLIDCKSIDYYLYPTKAIDYLVHVIRAYLDREKGVQCAPSPKCFNREEQLEEIRRQKEIAQRLAEEEERAQRLAEEEERFRRLAEVEERFRRLADKVEERLRRLAEEVEERFRILAEEERARKIKDEWLQRQEAADNATQRQIDDRNLIEKPISASPPMSKNTPTASSRGRLLTGVGSLVGSVIGGIGVTIASAAKMVSDGFKSAFNKSSVSNIADFNHHYGTDNVLSSIYAPAEVKRASHMLVQVFLHSPKETNKVQLLALEADKGTERRDYTPLTCKLQKGDKVDVHLDIRGETLLMSEVKSIVWQGTHKKCRFDFSVPKDIDVDELSCVALLTANGIPIGEMSFITQVVDKPKKANSEIFARKYNQVFISYAHEDEEKVKLFAEGFELMEVPYFFDRRYLKIGDVFPRVIEDYINSSDLFVLCWSKNAEQSEYVRKELDQALKLAYPQVQPASAAKLSIYPYSIEPRADLPSDMKDIYHFGKL